MKFLLTITESWDRDNVVHLSVHLFFLIKTSGLNIKNKIKICIISSPMRS